MADRTEPRSPAAALPDDVVSTLAGLDDGQLRRTAEYIQDLLEDQRPVSEEIEEEAGEELVRVTEHDRYTAVVKYQSGSDGTRHGPYLYHVRRVGQADGSENLVWSYIGRVRQ